ncbi:uncharacterized protein [Dysidea avara]|uniref:uncharacterized protein isoform X2 n=1 Tax=Dysidea avara TaxID=196820 RepID=UPI00332BEC5C
MLIIQGNIFLICFIFLVDHAATRITSIPHQRYVLEGSRTSVRCQNRSDDESTFYSYITNAVWYHDQNGNITKIGSSGAVYAQRHILHFRSITSNEEGVYYCCISGGPCGNSSSASTTVQISTPPVIVASNPKYTTTVGTQVTLACDIIDRGFPPATFGWIRDGHDLRNDHSVIANGSVISLTMCNVKIASAGKYTCTASNAGLSYRTDTVELNVLERSYDDINTTNASNYHSATIYLKSKTDVNSSCHHTKLERQLYEALKNYHQTCNYRVKVECNDTEKYGAVYYIQLNGPKASDILQSWLQNEQNNYTEVDNDKSTLTISVPTLFPTGVISDHNKSEPSESFIPIVPTGIIIIIMSTALIVAFSVCIIYCLYRYRKGMYDMVKSMKFKNNTFTDGVEQVVTLSPANYKKLPYLDTSSVKSSAEESTLQKTKCDYTVVSNRPAINAMVDGRSSAKRKEVLKPPIWDINTDSVLFTPS